MLLCRSRYVLKRCTPVPHAREQGRQGLSELGQVIMPALIAARFNPDLKAKYQQMVATGKPAKIAITAIMRKLIVTANALLKADRCWQQSPA